MRARWNLTVVGLGLTVTVATALQGLNAGVAQFLARPYLLAAAALTGIVAGWQLIAADRMSRSERSRWSTGALVPTDPHRVGPYQIESRLGSGAMGRAYLGVSKNGTLVAVKVVRPELSDDPEFRRRFAREITAVGKVHGRYTVALLDADAEAAQPWLATTYVPGGSLQQAIDKHGPLAPVKVWRLAAGIAEALEDIHRAGMVHRDLKPGNILLGADGPRVIDFGIARAADASQLTATMVRPGTPAFMAPEQVRNETVGPAADVFALGLVLAYAATGRPPFGLGASDAVLFRVVHEDPDLSGVDGPLRDLIEQCTSKDPSRRPTPEQIVARSREWTGAAGEEPLPALDSEAFVTVTAPRQHRWSIGVGVVALVVALAAAAVQFLPTGPSTVTSTPPRPSNDTSSTPSTSPTTTSDPVDPPSAPPQPSNTNTNSQPGVTPPAMPTNLAATATSDTSIRLQWADNSSDETGFAIYNGTTKASADTATNTTIFNWGGLPPGTQMCFAIRAYNSGGSSGFFPSAYPYYVCVHILAVVTGTSRADGAGGLTATATGTDTVRLQWTDNSSNETGFDITNDSGTTHTAGANATQYDWTGLTGGTTMCFHVRAGNSAGSSAYSPTSATVCAKTPGPPAAPSNVTVNQINSNTVRVQWTDNSDNETGFVIDTGVGLGIYFANGTKTVGANVTSADFSLPDGSWRCFTVSAQNSYGAGGATPTWTCAPGTSYSKPATPTGATATAMGSTRIRVQWIDNSNNEALYSLSGPSNVQLPPNTTSYDFKFLTPGTQYCFGGGAWNLAGSSSGFGSVCATTAP